MRFKIKPGEKEYEIEILEVKEGLKIRVNEKEFFFKREEREIREGLAQPSLPKRDFLKKEISAPIPGVISEIFVKEGELVKKGQRLLSISAMKMENEILTDRDGKIKKIFVKEGQEVKKGEILIILE